MELIEDFYTVCAKYDSPAGYFGYFRHLILQVRGLNFDVSYYRKKKENLSKHHQLLENFVLLQIYKIINVYLQK